MCEGLLMSTNILIHFKNYHDLLIYLKSCLVPCSEPDELLIIFNSQVWYSFLDCRIIIIANCFI
jgi:hypothetical protein